MVKLIASFASLLIWVVTFHIRLGCGTITDVFCLRTLKDSIGDPLGYLSSWNFNDTTEGSICKFVGVECWHVEENKVLNLKLSGFGLTGNFPSGLENCSSLTGLDLSSNNLSGTLPVHISREVAFVTVLDLSSNKFSGVIPESLANCTYLNVLRLNSNQLTGTIPPHLGLLARLREFSVASNHLIGLVPTFINSTFTESSYASNPGLCGPPLKACQGSEKIHAGIIAGTSTAAVVLMVTVLCILFICCSRRVKKLKKDDDLEGNQWTKSFKGLKRVKVSMFDKSPKKMSLKDLMKATNKFSKNNIIGSGRTGTMYKAVMSENNFLMIKRLQDNQLSEKVFMAEMNTLGNVRHRNLVPLLGYCTAKKERLLIYKYISNGTLYDNLHPSDNKPRLDWQTRLKIAIGTARGLAWLHHSCNPRIIHRNISSKCILLDEDFEPLLADFGLARLMDPLDTHLSTFVNGDFGDIGYVAPEYPRTLVATPKGDVFSFGTVLLELITNELPTGVANPTDDFKGSLVERVHHLSKNSKLHTAIHKGLTGKGSDDELHQFIRVACNCVSVTPKERPTMFEVYQLLRAIGEKYNFSVDDDISIPVDAGNEVHADEYIVAMESIQE